MGTITVPTALTKQHDVSNFRSGIESLDRWLQSKSHVNEAKGGSRTYVVCDGESKVVGFYSLAASGVAAVRVSRRVGRNMPDPVPVILLGQLATHEDYRGIGLGGDLLMDACFRALRAAETIGARAIVVQAVDEAAKTFYKKYDFAEFSSEEPLMLLLPFSVLVKLQSRPDEQSM